MHCVTNYAGIARIDIKLPIYRVCVLEALTMCKTLAARIQKEVDVARDQWASNMHKNMMDTLHQTHTINRPYI